MPSLKTAPKRASTFIKTLVIGDSGSGKTTLLGTFPKPYVCDFDGKGTDLLAGVDGWLEGYVGGWERFKADLKIWQKTGLPEDCLTVGIDSLTFAADEALKAAMAKAGNSGNATQADWGRAIKDVKDVLGALTTLPCNVIVNVHVQVEKDELLGGIIWQPSIFGRQLPSQLPGYFDDVWSTRITPLVAGGAKYELLTRPDTRLKMLKNSAKGAWDAVETPNYNHLLNKLKEKK